MKRFTSGIFWILIIYVLVACQGEPGPMGPVGPPGQNGQDGLNGAPVVALMYEVEFDLNSGNDWRQLYEFPQEDEIFETDMVLVYILYQVENGIKIWRLMPINFYDNRGVLSLNYDFTQNDVSFFAEASFTPNPDLDHFDNETARIVIVPADKSPNQRKTAVDYQNFEAVQAAFGLKEAKKIEASKN